MLLNFERMQYRKPDVAIVIPTFNEERAVGRVIDGIHKVMKGRNYHIVIVDGHSTDKTVEIAKNRRATVVFQKEKGYGNALLTGFKYVHQNLKAPITVMMDADGTYDAKDLPKMIRPVTNGENDLIIGNRFLGMHDGAMSLINRIGNRILSWMARKILGLKIYDTQCGIRVFRTRLIQNLDFQAEGMPFATEMLVKIKETGASIQEVPVAYRKRLGETKLNPIRDGLGILGTILRLARNSKIFSLLRRMGLLFSFFGVFFGAALMIKLFTEGTLFLLAFAVLSLSLEITGTLLFWFGSIACAIEDNTKRMRSSRVEVKS